MKRYLVNEKTKKIHKKPTKVYKCPSLYFCFEENLTDYSSERMKKELKDKKNYYNFCKRCMPGGKESII